MTKEEEKLEAINRFFTAYADRDRDGIGAVLADQVERTIPGRHALAGTTAASTRCLPSSIGWRRRASNPSRSYSAATTSTSSTSPRLVDRGRRPRGYNPALVGHFGTDGKVDRIVKLSVDQHEMDAFVWSNSTSHADPTALCVDVEDRRPAKAMHLHNESRRARRQFRSSRGSPVERLLP
jgi:uncharacterized protein